MNKIKVLVTAGPTIEMIDPVRYISNFSSGKQGYHIAENFMQKGCDVTLVSGPVNLKCSDGIKLIKVKSAKQMLKECLNHLPSDIMIACAAVCDWKPATQLDSKLKKTEGQEKLTLEFEKNPDILHNIGHHKNSRPKVVIGFAAETNDLIENAQKKLLKKNCDAIFANDVSGSGVFGKDQTRLHLITKDLVEDCGNQSKEESASLVADKAISFLTK